MEKTFAIHNFGCKVNQEEGGALAALLTAEGWTFSEDPALIVVNTCTVTAVADKKSRNLMRRLRREHPHALIAVCGCYAQRAPEEIAALDCVDLISGVAERRLLPRLIEEYLAQPVPRPLLRVRPISEEIEFHRIAPNSLQSRERAYLKIEDGCDQFCNYCIIPYVRGSVRSLPLEQAREQAKALLEAGHKEIVLSGIHIGAYGRDLPEGEDLPALIRALLALDKDFRLRLGSIEPQQFSEELRQLIADEPRICPHLHIPLQSGCDRTLTAMGRHYTTAEYKALLEDLGKRRPGIAFTTDVIVGYPGESDEDLDSTRQFIAGLPLSALHVFPYSRRSGTPAAAAPRQIPQSKKEERAGRLIMLARTKHQSYAADFLGQTLQMLGEEVIQRDGESFLRGRSENYLVCLLPWQTDRPARRELFPVIPTEIQEDGLIVRDPSD